MEKALIEAAINTVNMFDQANTNKIVERLGNQRGWLLKDAIEKLREVVNEGTQRTILSKEEANRI